MMTVESANISDLENIRRFYKKCGYGGGCNKEDTILIAKKDKKIIGVVRLCNENGKVILRGMQVDPAHRNKGIGKQLLLKLNDIIKNKDCYCLPYAHLINLYKQIGFKQIDLSGAPSFLQTRYKTYIRKGLNVVMMKKSTHHA
jgi:N-acetylglutamate synthase-like GNAT family acetyltransferase